MGADKFFAKKKFWRISELKLLSVAFLGGAMGTWLGMYLFRHKTLHYKFIIGVPLLVVLNMISFYYCIT